MTTIRRAVEADAWAVAVCQSTCWEQTYRGHVRDAYLDTAGPHERFPRWQERIAAGRDVWVAEADTDAHADAPTVVGVASAGPSRDTPPVRPLELMSLYTLARVHGTGVGSRLLTAAIGTHPASLWVFVDNHRAQAFYRRHGFVFDGTEVDDVGTRVREVRMVR